MDSKGRAAVGHAFTVAGKLSRPRSLRVKTRFTREISKMQKTKHFENVDFLLEGKSDKKKAPLST
jgi:hypothetical protein